MFVSFNSNNTFITRGAEIAYPPGSPEIIRGAEIAYPPGSHEIPPVIFSRTFVAHSIIFCVVLCQPLFISFYPFLAIALFVLGYTTSDYPFVFFTFLIIY
jgi:hypothetical protein